MKNFIIILGLFSLSLNYSYALDNFYYHNHNPHNSRYFQNNIDNGIYYPYQYSSIDRYKQFNRNDLKRIERIEKFKALNRLGNFVTWNRNYRVNRKLNNRMKNNIQNNPTFDNGQMTGYSVPINQNDYNKTINTPMYDNYKKSFTNDRTNLYSMPQGSEYNYDDGRMYKKFNEVSGGAGVRIIYD